MKKITTIITILFLLSFAAFAGASGTETHRVTITTDVGIVIPAFQFSFSGGMLDTADAVTTNSGAKGYGEEDFNEFATDNAAVEVADISVNGLDLLFTARLANTAKCNNSYTLRFLAGGFDVYRNGVPGKLNPSSDPKITISPDIASLQGLTVTSVSPDTIRVTFNGSDCVIGEIASFNVKYSPDASLDPTEGGFYYADISLEISSDY